jgi:DNA segregation ATPase FtsK/SpoIIIE, S-DNA-T family
VARKKRKKTKKTKLQFNHEIVGIIFIATGLIMITSLIGSSLGIVTSSIKNVLTGFMGIGAYLMPLLLIYIGIMAALNRLKILSRPKITVLIMLVCSALVVCHLSAFGNEKMGYIEAMEFGYNNTGLNRGGGLIGFIISAALKGLVGTVPTYIIVITTIIISTIVLTGWSVKKIIISLNTLLTSVYNYLKDILTDLLHSSSEAKPKTAKSKFKTDELPQQQLSLSMEPEDIKIIDNSKKPLDALDNAVQDSNPVSQAKPSAAEKNDIVEEQKSNLEISSLEIGKVFTTYSLPSTVLLDEYDNKKNNNDRKQIITKAKILEDTLANFGIGAKVIQVSKGPAITRYELQPSPGIKVSKIVNLSDDLALSLAAPSVRIEAPIPGKSAIGIEIPNKEVNAVAFREVIENDSFKQASSKLSIALGKDIAGETIVTDLAKMPHLLIAGATGSGKSVCVNTIISSILYKAAPHEVKMILVDPKMVELSNYNGIPHLLVPVVTDPKKAVSALSWAVQEMTNRYKQFSKEGVKDIFKYNQLMKENMSEELMPQIVIIIDELADLMMVSASEIEDLICRLAQMARAAGIHLIVATQRPSVDVITGVIKANIPSRISFAVSSQTDSRTILDGSGAEKLLGRGDMLFHPVGDSKMTRIQCAYISEKEVDRIVEFIKNQTDPQYSTQILEELSKPKNVENFPEDELYQQALRLIVETQQASISMLQRRLKIGYARAARLIDELESKGVIGGYEGSKPRHVLISESDLSDS